MSLLTERRNRRPVATHAWKGRSGTVHAGIQRPPRYDNATVCGVWPRMARASAEPVTCGQCRAILAAQSDGGA